MKSLGDKSIDMVLTDLPYGTTQNKWDVIVPFKNMWSELDRICKSNANKVFFSQQPFTTSLISSNIKEFISEWIFEKSQAAGGFQAKRRVLKKHENVITFNKNEGTYNPVMELKTPEQIRRSGSVYYVRRNDGEYDKRVRKDPKNPLKYPSSVQRFDKEIWNGKEKANGFHPTQKPINICEYFIKTYSNEGETVLDFTMGSGSTGVACKNLNRKFIGIEKDKTYFEIAKARIAGSRPSVQLDMMNV